MMLSGTNELCCTRCDLHKYATTVKVESRGAEHPLILFVAEAPGKTENVDGRCLVGKSGKKINDLIIRAGIDPATVRFTNTVRCIPWKDPNTKTEIRYPSQHEVEACSKYLDYEIYISNPLVVVPLGNIAFKYFIEGAPTMGKAHGTKFLTQIPSRNTLMQKMKDSLKRSNISFDPSAQYDQLMKCCLENNISIYSKEYIVIPTWHPASTFYSGGFKKEDEIVSDLKYINKFVNGDKNKENDYKLLCSLEEIEEFCKFLLDGYYKCNFSSIALDVETNSLNSFNDDADLFLFSISWEKGKAVSIPYNHPESPFHNDILQLKAISSLVQGVLDIIPVVNHNIKFDIHWLHKFGMDVRKIEDCTYLASWTLFNNTRKHDLESLASEFTDLNKHKEEMQRELRSLENTVFDKQGNPRDPIMGDVPIDLVHTYGCMDVDATLRLNTVFTKMLVDENLYEFHHKYVVDCILPTVRMERNGILYDLDFNEKVQLDYKQKINDYYFKLIDSGILGKAEKLLEKEKEEVYNQKLCDWVNNGQVTNKPVRGKVTKIQLMRDSVFVPVVTLSSVAVKRKILFEILGLPSIKKTDENKEDSQDSTDKEVLETLLYECKTTQGLYSDKDSIESKAIADFYQQKIDVLETLINFNNDNTIYSRYISKLPDHVCSDKKLHTSLGIGTTETSRWNCTNPSLHVIPKKSLVKKAFRSIFEDGLIALADYSQNELKFLATVSGDEELKRIFRDGEDLHEYVAKLIGKDRKTAKATNFGIAYGEGDYGLARRLGIPKLEAKKIIDGWYDRFYGVKNWVLNQHKLSMQSDKVWTMTGFRRIIDKSMFSQQEIERRFVNTPIQGPASNVGALAISIIDQKLIDLNMQSNMFAFIHDAIGFSVFPGELYKVMLLTKKVMEKAIPDDLGITDVPFRADFQIGTTWYDLLDVLFLRNNEVSLSGKKEAYKDFVEVVSRWGSNKPEFVKSLELGEDSEYEVSVVYKMAV